VEICYKCGVRVVTLYAFSIENFKRPKSEVDSLIELFKIYLCSMSERGGLLDQYGVAMRVLGRLELLNPDVQSTIQRTTDLTREYGDKILNVCISYTSRDEISTAIRQTVADCNTLVELPRECPALSPETYTLEIINPLYSNTKVWKEESFCSGSSKVFRDELDKSPSDLVPACSNQIPLHSFVPPSVLDGLDKASVDVGQPMVISTQHITTETLTDRMLTADNPPLDLLIRTSAVYRLGDFLLWQCHQGTHIVFLTALWPDFGLWQFFSVIREWQRGKQKLVNENRKVRTVTALNIN
jgi:ditrans,polycis-polyprenyl diphosphate synthase